jgi:hypothetical protein
MVRGRAKYDYPVEKTCPICYSEWEATTSKQVENKETCSPECANAMRAWKQRGTSKERESKPPEERDGMVKVECAKCGAERWERKDRVEGNNFCSRECYQQWQKEDLDMSDHLREIAPKGERSPEALERLSERMSGENNPAWKGGVTEKKRKGNYKQEKLVRCPDEFEKMARANGYVPVHRLKVAKELGRPLTSTEVVHHKDHDNHNNDLENLELWPNNRLHKLAEGNREEYLSERLWPEPPV